MKKRILPLLCGVVVLMLVTSCNSSLQADAAEKQLEEAQPSEVIRGTTKGQYAKPGAPVDLSYVSGKVDNPGDTVAVDAMLHLNAFNLSSVTVQVNIDAGVSLTESPGDNFPIDLQSGQLDYTLKFVAFADAIGVHYINVIVTTSQGDQQRSRAFSLPFHVGDDSEIQSQKATISPTKVDANGELVLPMAAQEVITPAK